MDAQKEQLGHALRSLQSEHAELHRRACALRDDNDVKAELISAIEGIELLPERAAHLGSLRKAPLSKGLLKLFLSRLKHLREVKRLF